MFGRNSFHIINKNWQDIKRIKSGTIQTITMIALRFTILKFQSKFLSLLQFCDDNFLPVNQGNGLSIV